MGLARGGDCGSTSPQSLYELAKLRTHITHYSPVMIALLSINSSHADCRPERLFFHAAGQMSAPRRAGQSTTSGSSVSGDARG